MKEWADRVGRSTRLLQGLERGEVAGRDTLERIESALQWPEGRCEQILDGGEVVVDGAGVLRYQPPAGLVAAVTTQATGTFLPPKITTEVVGLGLDDEARRRGLSQEQVEAVLTVIRNMGDPEE